MSRSSMAEVWARMLEWLEHSALAKHTNVLREQNPTDLNQLKAECREALSIETEVTLLSSGKPVESLKEHFQPSTD